MGCYAIVWYDECESERLYAMVGYSSDKVLDLNVMVYVFKICMDLLYLWHYNKT